LCGSFDIKVLLGVFQQKQLEEEIKKCDIQF